MSNKVEKGVLASISKRERLNISGLRKEGQVYKCTWSDGAETLGGQSSSEQFNAKIDAGDVVSGSTVQISDYVCQQQSSTAQYLIAYEIDEISKVPEEAKEEPKSVKKEAAGRPLAVKTEVYPEAGIGAAAAQSIATPRAAKENAAPLKTPASKVASQYTPGMTPPSTGRKAPQPIQALNPYNNNWTIKARVTNKTPLRSFNRDSSGPQHVFSVTLVDEQGSEIEGTFWRDVAQRLHPTIEEAKVYFFTKGRVKPANKAYSSTRNSYSIDFVSDTLVEEAIDVDPNRMQAKLNYTRLDGLHHFLGKKALTDVIGVVKEVQALGSIKRKSDGTDLPRRDVTLADQSGKTVRVTMWGGLAENEGSRLEESQESFPILSISNVRVSDYDGEPLADKELGLSLSTVTRSVVTVNPDSKEGEALRVWWTDQGTSMTFSRASDGLPASNRSQQSYSSERVFLKDIVKEKEFLPPPEAKPEFSNVKFDVGQIDPDQTPFFYPADAATGKKAVKRDDGWRLAAEDKPCEMEWRYFLRLGIQDHTGCGEVFLSNEQAEKLLGQKAQELYELRESNKAKFQEVLAAKQFSQWTFVLKSNTSEYRGELRQRLQGVGKLQTLDYAAESKLLVSQIAALK